MHLVTKQMLVATAAERYREAHQRRGEWLSTHDGSDPQTIYERLKALPAAARAAEIAAITGDSRWTENICDECGGDREAVVMVAIEAHHPIDMTALCTACLHQAMQLVSA
ncbi:MAG: hypothetical protein IT329_10305 [Caldilineaceae bacterium]|nr:hypothetical protein [Caldilineaceae bacterium]